MEVNGHLRSQPPVEPWLDRIAADINSELLYNERIIIDLRKRELITAQDYKELERLQKRQEELELHQFELREFLARQANFEEDTRRFQDERQRVQQQITTMHDKLREESLIKEIAQRGQRLDWERMALEETRQKLQNLARAQHPTFNRQLEQQRLYEQELREQEELNKRMAERELIKEENYRNFYKGVSDKQAGWQQLHVDRVLQPLIQRQAQLEQMISRNVDQYQNQLLQDELNRIKRRKAECEEMLRTNKLMIGRHQSDLAYQRVEKVDYNKKRLDEIEQYNAYLRYVKNEKLDKQREYRDFLDQQREEKEYLNLQQYRMGREKSMNNPDLQSYKRNEGSLHSMIPGWSPQIGQLPPRQHYEFRSPQTDKAIVKQNLSHVNHFDYRQNRNNQFQGVGYSLINRPSSYVSPIP